jgi:hypothetical protein
MQAEQEVARRHADPVAEALFQRQSLFQRLDLLFRGVAAHVQAQARAKDERASAAFHLTFLFEGGGFLLHVRGYAGVVAIAIKPFECAQYANAAALVGMRERQLVETLSFVGLATL